MRQRSVAHEPGGVRSASVIAKGMHASSRREALGVGVDVAETEARALH